MLKLTTMMLMAAVAVSACNRNPRLDAPPPAAAPVNDEAAISQRVVTEINALRANIGAPGVTENPMLDRAAEAHARDMSAQNRAWHFGSDGTSPLDRVRKQGFNGHLIGENISETYEDEIATLSAWMRVRDTRDVIMDPKATEIGIGRYREASGKIWWVLLTAGGTATGPSGFAPSPAATEPGFGTVATPAPAGFDDTVTATTL